MNKKTFSILNKEIGRSTLVISIVILSIFAGITIYFITKDTSPLKKSPELSKYVDLFEESNSPIIEEAKEASKKAELQSAQDSLSLILNEIALDIKMNGTLYSSSLLEKKLINYDSYKVLSEKEVEFTTSNKEKHVFSIDVTQFIIANNQKV